MMRLQDLPPDAQKRVLAAPPDLQPLLIACYPDDAQEAAARRDAALRQGQREQEELAMLRQLADDLEGGVYGPVGVELARQMLVSGRNYTALASLPVGVRKLRLQRAVPAQPAGKRQW